MIIITLLIVLACLFVFTGKPVVKHLKKNYTKMAIVILYGCAIWVAVATVNLVSTAFVPNSNGGIADNLEMTAYADGGEYSFQDVINTLAVKLKSYQKAEEETVETEDISTPTAETISSDDTSENLYDPLAANTTYEAEVNPDEVEGPPCLGSFVESNESKSSQSTTAKKPATATTLSTKTGKTSKYNLSEADKVALQKVALAEAKCDGVKGMALVMKVILNRLESEKFPNSVMGIITQKNQFSTYYNGNYNKAKLCEESAQALELVLNGWDESYGALYFEHNPSGKSTWQRKNLTTLFTYKGHTFSK